MKPLYPIQDKKVFCFTSHKYIFEPILLREYDIFISINDFIIKFYIVLYLNYKSRPL